MPQRNLDGPGLHHVAMRARDFDATLRFYTEGVGCSRVYGWGEGDGRAAMLDAGDGNYVEVFAGRKAAADDDAPDGGWLHLAFRVADTDAAFNRAIAAGARPTMQPADVGIPGDHTLRVRIAFVKGPDGEIIEFFHNDEL